MQPLFPRTLGFDLVQKSGSSSAHYSVHVLVLLECSLSQCLTNNVFPATSLNRNLRQFLWANKYNVRKLCLEDILFHWCCVAASISAAESLNEAILFTPCIMQWMAWNPWELFFQILSTGRIVFDLQYTFANSSRIFLRRTIMYSLFNEGAEQLYSEEGALVKSPREEGGLCCAES